MRAPPAFSWSVVAVACAAKLLSVPAVVYCGSHASPVKLDAIRSYSAEVQLIDGDCLAAEKTARRVAEQTGRVFISPYNDLVVCAGQGTLGLELSEQFARRAQQQSESNGASIDAVSDARVRLRFSALHY